MKRYINSLYSFGTKKSCHKNGKNPLLFQFIRKAVNWTLTIMEKFHSYLSILKNIMFLRRWEDFS